MKKIVLFMALIVLTGFTAAQDFESLNTGDLSEYESMINNQTESMPSFASGLLGNQTINLVIEDNGDTTTAGAKIEGLTLTDLQSTGYENATIEVTTDQETVEAISESETPVNEALSQFEKGNITYEAEGFWNKIKLAIVEPFLT